MVAVKIRGRVKRKEIVYMSIQKEQIKTCLENANGFLNTAKNCMGTVAYCPAICLTNFGIACELFLKAIAMQKNPDGQYSKKHLLADLINNLPEENRTEIEKRFNASGNSIKLEEFLRQSQNLFVEWRYEFEQEKININVTALEKFAETLKQYCAEI